MGLYVTTLRFILGDQLNPEHSWFTTPSSDIVYTMMEVRQETDYVLHHAQKIIGIFAGMRDLARMLLEQGHRVHYIAIDDPQNQQSLTANLDLLLSLYKCDLFEYQEPDEWRLDEQLKLFCKTLQINSRMVSSEHFYATRDETATLFTGQKQWLMERFYRQMRTRHGVLMQNAKTPVGDKWNFDQENRKSWIGTPAEPAA